MTFGINRLIQDLSVMGFEGVITQRGNDGLDYAVIPNFIIPAGSFAGRIVSLGIPAFSDYPRLLGRSMHVKTNQNFLPVSSIPLVRNILPSPLGAEWQYWSYQFNVRQNNPTNELISQINEIFRKN